METIEFEPLFLWKCRPKTGLLQGHLLPEAGRTRTEPATGPPTVLSVITVPGLLSFKTGSVCAECGWSGCILLVRVSLP